MLRYGAATRDFKPMSFPAGNLGQCIADLRKTLDCAHARALERRELFRCCALAPGDDGTRMPHPFARRCRDAGDVADYRLGHVRFDVFSGFLFRDFNNTVGRNPSDETVAGIQYRYNN